MKFVRALFLLIAVIMLGTIMEASADESVPLHFDWRNIDGHSYLTYIRNQSICQSGTAFAYIGMLEASMKIALDNYFIDPDLSEQQIYSCAGGMCLQPPAASEIASLLLNEGVADEDCLPFAGADNAECATVCMDSQNRTVLPSDSLELYFPSPTGIFYALLDGPLVVRMLLHLDYLTYEGGIYEHQRGSLPIGVHDLLIVGYDAEAETWIVKESRGEDWGEGGFARISWYEPMLGESIVQMRVDIAAICGENDAPTIRELVIDPAKVTDEVFFTFGYADADANLRGGELWYRLDDGEAQRFPSPLTSAYGVDSYGRPISGYHLPIDLPAGEHKLTIFVRDICHASSTALVQTFTVSEQSGIDGNDGQADMNDDDEDNASDDDSTGESMSSNDDDDDDETNEGGCGW